MVKDILEPVIKGYPRLSEVIQILSIILDYQRLSEVILGYPRLSELISVNSTRVLLSVSHQE